MSSLNKTENANIDVWGSIRNIKKKIRGSKTENEIASLLQKSQNSTKFSSNTSIISQKGQKDQDISNFEENPSNFCSRKTCSNEEEDEKSRLEDVECPFSLKNVFSLKLPLL